MMNTTEDTSVVEDEGQGVRDLAAAPPLETTRLIHKEMGVALAVARRHVAPPDGRNRQPLRIRSAEASTLLGRSAAWLRSATEELGIGPETAGEYRALGPEEMRAIRKAKLPQFDPTGERRPFVLAVANQKGGVGKTTTAINLVQDMASRGYRCLIVDLDPQSSMTASFLVDRGDGELVSDADLGLDKEGTAYSVMTGQVRTFEGLIRRTHWPTIDIVPSAPDLSHMVTSIATMIQDGERDFWGGLMAATRSLSVEDYDLVVLDTTPSVSLDIIQVSLAADAMLIPLPMRMLDIESGKAMMGVLSDWFPILAKHYRFGMRWMRFLVTQYVASSTSEAKARMLCRRVLGDLLLESAIPRMAALERGSGGAPSIWETPPVKPKSVAASARAAREQLRKSHDEILEMITSVQGVGA